MSNPHPDTSHRDSAVCPWCGFEHPDSGEWHLPKTICEECHNCRKVFLVTRHVTLTYSTRKVEPKTR